MVTDETLRLATDRLVAHFRPQRVILFGSQARGTADARSDVDLLVICPVPPGPGIRRALMVAMDRALRGVEIATDFVILTPEEFERDRQIPGTMARPAWREGKGLYEAS
ncbi:MAG: nucleotidyltransferase domain-containing protein [Terriglobia bacterium]